MRHFSDLARIEDYCVNPIEKLIIADWGLIDDVSQKANLSVDLQ